MIRQDPPFAGADVPEGDEGALAPSPPWDGVPPAAVPPVGVPEADGVAALVPVAPWLAWPAAGNSATGAAPGFTGAVVEVVVGGGAAGLKRDWGLANVLMLIMHNKIHTAATPMVIRVNVSPALVPNALWPPSPPKAPANPPPLPRWIRMIPIKIKAVRNNKVINNAANMLALYSGARDGLRRFSDERPRQYP